MATVEQNGHFWRAVTEGASNRMTSNLSVTYCICDYVDSVAKRPIINILNSRAYLGNQSNRTCRMKEAPITTTVQVLLKLVMKQPPGYFGHLTLPMKVWS